MCYTRKDHGDLEKESRRMTESRLMEEEALPSSKSVCSILPIAIYGPGSLGHLTRPFALPRPDALSPPPPPVASA